MTNRFEFKVVDMDCAEEVAILKRALSKSITFEHQLEFDVLRGKLTVELEGDFLQERDLIQLIEKTGMKAIRWEKHLTKSQQPKQGWSTDYRFILTCLSGGFLLTGYLLHAGEHGLLAALLGRESRGLIAPTNAMLLYLLSIITRAWFVFPKALVALKYLRPDMNLLMIIAVMGAVGIGQWFEAATVAFLFSLALLLETWSIGRARQAIRSMLEAAPKTASVVLSDETTIEERVIDSVQVGQTLLIRPGEKIPLDGEITQGTTHINQAPITGESMLVSKSIGDKVYAGTLNTEGSVRVCVTKAAGDTTLDHIIHRIEEAQAHRAHTEQWVDTFARYYTPLMIILAIMTAVVPPLLFQQAWVAWFYQGLVILVIACPCALVISTPISIVAGLCRAARQGVLVKGGVYLEQPATLKAIALDKTGTLTTGKPQVQQLLPLGKYTENSLLSIASALEYHSKHPIAHAICERAKTEAMSINPASSFRAIQGKGGEGMVNGENYWIGSHRLLREKVSGHAVDVVKNKAMRFEALGQTVVILGQGDHVCGLIGVSDQLREKAHIAMQALKVLGIEKLLMLTGDNNETARAISNAAGIDAYQAELLPEDKINHIKTLKSEYQQVAMIGDGVNDAPAMATATLGIAMGAMGSDVAIETADIALMTDDLTKIAWLIQHSRQTRRVIKQNIVFSLMVKAIFLTLAIVGLATLWMAIAADMGATLIVIFNGLRLLRFKTTIDK